MRAILVWPRSAWSECSERRRVSKNKSRVEARHESNEKLDAGKRQAKLSQSKNSELLQIELIVKLGRLGVLSLVPILGITSTNYHR